MRKKKHATPKNDWFGEWEVVRENPTSDLLIVIPSTATKTAIIDADMTTTKKKY